MPEQENQTPPASEVENEREVRENDEEQDPAEPFDPDEQDIYEGGGFDPEQRRLLWTIAIVIIIGIFAATWLDIIYADRRAARTLHGQEVLNNYALAHSHFLQEQTQAYKALLPAMAQNDQQNVEAIMKATVAAFKGDSDAAAALHHEEGVDDQPLSRDDINNFANGMLNDVAQRLDQMRQARAAAATQPSATQSSPSATAPAPTGSPLLQPAPAPGGKQ